VSESETISVVSFIGMGVGGLKFSERPRGRKPSFGQPVVELIEQHRDDDDRADDDLAVVLIDARMTMPLLII